MLPGGTKRVYPMPARPRGAAAPLSACASRLVREVAPVALAAMAAGRRSTVSSSDVQWALAAVRARPGFATRCSCAPVSLPASSVRIHVERALDVALRTGRYAALAVGRRLCVSADAYAALAAAVRDACAR